MSNGSEEVKPVFQKGKFTVHTKVLGQKNPQSLGYFVHSDEPVNRLIDMLTDVSYEAYASQSNDPERKEDFKAYVQRMVYLYMAKQLSTAVGGSCSDLTQTNMGVVAAEFKFPVQVISLLNGYGFIEDKEGDWEMMGQALWSMTYLGRALCKRDPIIHGVTQEITRDKIFVNLAHGGWEREVKECYLATVRLWAKNCRPVRVQVSGGAEVELEPGVFHSGARAYLAYVAPWNPGPPILKAIRILSLLEGLIDENLGTASVGAFNEEGIVFVNWRRDEISELVHGYRQDIESVLLMPMMSIWKVETVKTTGKVGALWQLYARGGQDMYGPRVLNGDGEQTGWAMSHDLVLAQPPAKSWMVHNGSTYQDKLRGVVHSFTKF